MTRFFIYVRGHTYSPCRLYYQQIIYKYKCLPSFFFFLLSLNWVREREYVIAVLSFLTGSFGEYFLFYRLAEFYIARLECICHLVQEFSASSPGVLATVFRPICSSRPPFQNWYSFSLFLLTEEGATSALGFWPII